MSLFRRLLSRCLAQRSWLVLVTLGLVIAVGVRSAEARAVLKTALILPEVLPGVPVQPLGLVTSAPVREDIVVPSAVGQEHADLYRPAPPGRYGAVILHLGVNPDPDDPTLHRLAAALARTGTVAVIPRSPRLQESRISPDEVEAIVATFQYLQGLDFVDGSRIGLSGFCVGASLSALAAVDPRIAGQVAFVNFFGGYYDARDVVRAVATRQMQYQGTATPWEPNEMTVQVFARLFLETLEDAQDRALLEAALVRGEPVSGLPERLSPTGRSLYTLLSGANTPAEADALLASLSARARALLAALSPASVVDRLQTRVFIMHDRGDTYIPVAESRRFRDALGGRSVALYTEFSIFQHMHPRGARDMLTFLREAGLLYRHLYWVMAQVA